MVHVVHVLRWDRIGTRRRSVPRQRRPVPDPTHNGRIRMTPREAPSHGPSQARMIRRKLKPPIVVRRRRVAIRRTGTHLLVRVHRGRMVTRSTVRVVIHCRRRWFPSMVMLRVVLPVARGRSRLGGPMAEVPRRRIPGSLRIDRITLRDAHLGCGGTGRLSLATAVT